MVPLKKGRERFDIACYFNKVISLPKGVEKDMTEMMQSYFVFTRVSNGELAKTKDIKVASRRNTQSEVIKISLNSGELQVSKKEEAQQRLTTSWDIVTIVSQKVANLRLSCSYTVTTIMETMKKVLHFAIVPCRSAK